MATSNDPRTRKPWLKRQPSWPRHDGLFRFTVDQFQKLDELDFFDDRRVELIEGMIYEMTAKPPHAISTELVTRVLISLFGVEHSVRINAPLDLGRRSLPDPDFAIVEGSPRDYLDHHPTSALLVIEVSEATLRKDRALKAHLYAQAGIPDYWIVNLVARQLEIHRGPGPDPDRKGRFRYADVTIVPADGRATPLAKPEARIAVADLLP